MKYTDNQIDLLVNKTKERPKEWPREELLEAVYQYDLGKELYAYQYKYNQVPIPL